MTAAEINYAQNVLAGIVASTGGPNKLLIVHQFTPNMLPDKSAIASNPLVDVAIVMDGFRRALDQDGALPHVREGRPGSLRRNQAILRQDTGFMAPEDVLALDPPPDVIIYQ